MNGDPVSENPECDGALEFEAECPRHSNVKADDATIFCPGRYVQPHLDGPPFALLILNVALEEQLLPRIIANASFIICADGGANRLREAQLSSKDPHAHDWLPDIILGDLDSIHPEVKAYYEQRGVRILQDQDPNFTDMTKCMIHLVIKADVILARHSHPRPASQSARLDVVVLGSMDGRLDQAFSTLGALVSASEKPVLAPGQVFLVSPGNVTFVLGRALNRICTPLDDHVLEENVGIIPLRGPGRITTKGLEWDVTDWDTQFGGQMSTSNHIRSDVVDINTHGAGGMLFTVQLAGRSRGPPTQEH